MGVKRSFTTPLPSEWSSAHLLPKGPGNKWPQNCARAIRFLFKKRSVLTVWTHLQEIQNASGKLCHVFLAAQSMYVFFNRLRLWGDRPILGSYRKTLEPENCPFHRKTESLSPAVNITGKNCGMLGKGKGRPDSTGTLGFHPTSATDGAAWPQANQLASFRLNFFFANSMAW